MNTLALPDSNGLLIESSRMSERWWARPGALVSILLHVAAVVALIALSGHRDEPTPVDHAIQLVLTPPTPEPPKPIVQPPPPKAPPVKLQPPKPAPVQRPTPVSRRLTVPTTAEKAEVAAPPTPPEPDAKPTTEPVAPPAPPAPPARPEPRNIGMEGIPTDYVNQVYARINSSAAGHYPRVAKIRHLEGRIGYTLTLSPEGKLLKLDLQSSGESVLDDAAEEAIRAAAPFPHLPDLGGSSYQLTGAIVYRFGD
jgi:periplasmic protein TonB